MVPEAPLERTDAGLYPAGEGWFALNDADVEVETTLAAEAYGRFPEPSDIPCPPELVSE